MRGPERIETPRLVLRRPGAADAESIFARYASDPEVTRFLGWPRHESIGQTRAFVDFSDAEWERWPVGPYVIEARDGGQLLGGTGLAFETPFRAATGYVLAKDAWGKGFATEALGALVSRAAELGLRRLYALCSPDHIPSRRVLEKCGFTREALLRHHSEFPNHSGREPSDVLCYARLFGRGAEGSTSAERVFVALRSRGPAWDDAKPLEGQTDWPAHASFMDALYEQGFAALVGPLEETRDALLVLRAASTSEVAERLASDPWTTNGLLVTRQISPWLLRLGSVRK